MIDTKEIEKLAGLTRIDISEEEKEKLQGEIESILVYVSEIREVSREKTGLEVGRIYNVMREDGDPHAPEMYTKRLLDEVPQREGGYVKVKKIL